MTSYRRVLYDQYLSHLSEEDFLSHREQCARQARYFARLLSGYLPSAKDTPCLDLACGAGNFLYFLKAQCYHNLLGVDISPEQTALALDMGLPVSQGDVFQCLRSSEETYGLISALDLLEHLHKEEIMDLLGLIRDHLRPGGIFLARTPNGGSPFGGLIGYGDFTHETILTPSSARQILRQTGFKEIRFLEGRPLPLGLVSGLRSVLWQGVRCLYKFLDGVETGGFGPTILTQVFWWVAIK